MSRSEKGSKIKTSEAYPFQQLCQWVKCETESRSNSTPRMALTSYRPQRSWGKVIFSEARVHILSTAGVRGCSGGGGGCAWLLLGGCAWLLGGRAWLLPGGMRGIRRDTEIRSMSRRYASYWNAFLFM